MADNTYVLIDFCGGCGKESLGFVFFIFIWVL